MSGLEAEIQFIISADRLKNVVRKTRNISNERYENDAEHAWHACMMALALQHRANAPVDISRVLQMLIVHDLGEIEGGDVIVYERDSSHAAAERGAARAMLSLLEGATRERLCALFDEFEDRRTGDAMFANAIDRAEPLLQNICNNGETWRMRAITYEKIIEVNERKIREGSEQLWGWLRERIEKMKAEGAVG